MFGSGLPFKSPRGERCPECNPKVSLRGEKGATWFDLAPLAPLAPVATTANGAEPRVCTRMLRRMSSKDSVSGMCFRTASDNLTRKLARRTKALAN